MQQFTQLWWGVMNSFEPLFNQQLISAYVRITSIVVFLSISLSLSLSLSLWWFTLNIHLDHHRSTGKYIHNGERDRCNYGYWQPVMVAVVVRVA
jgi:hypothetical protein